MSSVKVKDNHKSSFVFICSALSPLYESPACLSHIVECYDFFDRPTLKSECKCRERGCYEKRSWKNNTSSLESHGKVMEFYTSKSVRTLHNGDLSCEVNPTP